MKRSLIGLVALVLLLGGTAWADTVLYTVTDLGTLGGDFSTAFAINDSGQVVGTARNASGEERAFLYDSGIMTGLGGRLFVELRDKRSLGYMAGSSFLPLKDGSMFYGYSNPGPQGVDEAIEVILNELAKVTKEPVREDELRRSKEWLIGSQVPLDPPLRGRTKHVRLAASAIEECLPALQDVPTDQVPLLLCIAEKERPGRISGLDRTLLPAVRESIRSSASSFAKCSEKTRGALLGSSPSCRSSGLLSPRPPSPDTSDASATITLIPMSCGAGLPFCATTRPLSRVWTSSRCPRQR